MEENQITCPQCGLVNNILEDACVQCGIIFVKDPAMIAAAAALDDAKRKSIEAAEAILDETQPPEAIPDDMQPPEAVAARDKEAIQRPDPHEDTVEIRVPNREEISPTEATLSDSQIPETVESKDENTAEIELEAIETAMETITEPTGGESLNLTDAKTDEPAKPAADATAEKLDEPASDSQKAANGPTEADKSVSGGKDNQDSKADEPAAKASKAELVASNPSSESIIDPESEKKQSAPAESAESKAADQKEVEPAKAGDDPISGDDIILKDEIQPAEPEILLEAASEVTPAENDVRVTEAQPDVLTLQESAPKSDETDAQQKQEAQKARQEALKKQQKALLKAEAREKEKAAQAQAAALKNKKLAQTRAEALKKQKAAQAKAEALKKKKVAQAKAMALKKQKANWARADALKKQNKAQAQAEASAGDAQVAAVGQSNHIKLLGLLKRYKGKAIGINYDNSAEIKEAELVEANEEFFSVMVREKKVQYSYPLKTILTIVEGEQGVETETGQDHKKAKFDAVIKVYPFVLS
mgnify:CR=1 FL=1